MGTNNTSKVMNVYTAKKPSGPKPSTKSPVVTGKQRELEKLKKGRLQKGSQQKQSSSLSSNSSSNNQKNNESNYKRSNNNNSFESVNERFLNYLSPEKDDKP